MKKIILKCLLFLLVTILPLIWLNWKVDPLQYIRKSDDPFFDPNERIQNPGLIRNYDFDSIILGTSMIQNFVSSFVSQELKGHFMKLSIASGTIFEQVKTLELALRNKKIKKVLWGVDFFSTTKRFDQIASNHSFPYYMYDDIKINDIKYLLDPYITRRSILVLFCRKFRKKSIFFKNLDLYKNWDKNAKYNKENVIRDYEKFIDRNEDFPEETYDFDIIKKNIYINIIKVIKENKNIDFIVFFPPYSLLRTKRYLNFGEKIINNFIDSKYFIFEELTKLENVKIYDFQDVFEITENLDNYKDIGHYSQQVNEKIIESIKNDRYKLTKKNIDERFKKFKKRIINFKY